MNTSLKRHLRSTRSRPQGSRHAQRGAIGMMAGFTLLIAVTFMVLALDTGRLWLERRNLQKAADMAAIEASRFTGCGSVFGDAETAARRAIEANKALSAEPITVLELHRGRITRDANMLTTFVVDNTELSNSAHIKLSKTVRSSLILSGLTANNTTSIVAEATAQGGPPIATFSVGSFFGLTQKQADLITALFKGILGNSSLNLTTAALTDLGASTINLLQLQAQAGVKTIDELLNLEVPLSELLQWILNTSPSSTAGNGALSQIISASLSSGLKVRIGDVLNVQIPASSATASVSINVLDLVNTSLIVGNGKNTINLGLNLAGIGGVSLGFLNPPRIAVGPAGKSLSGQWCTEAKSSQLSLAVKINPLGIGLVNMGLFVDLASTNANLARLNISPGATTGTIDAGATAVSLRLRNDKDTGPSSVFAGLLTVGLNLPLIDAQGGTANFTIQSKYDMPKSIQTSGVAGSAFAGLLGKTTSLEIKVLGFGGDLLKPIVQTIISPILGLIGEAIIDPLFQALGFDLGLVKVQLIDIKGPLPILRG